MDRFSRRVLSWRVSITMEVDSAGCARRKRLHPYGRPEIFFKYRSRSEFTSVAFSGVLSTMLFLGFSTGMLVVLQCVRRAGLWRSVKYEDESARRGAQLGSAVIWAFDNRRRLI